MKKVIEFEIAEDDIPETSKEFDFTDDLEKIVALYNGEDETESEGEYEEQELEPKQSSASEKKTGKKTGKKTTSVKNKNTISTKNAEILDDDEIPF